MWKRGNSPNVAGLAPPAFAGAGMPRPPPPTHPRPPPRRPRQHAPTARFSSDPFRTVCVLGCASVAARPGSARRHLRACPPWHTDGVSARRAPSRCAQAVCPQGGWVPRGTRSGACKRPKFPKKRAQHGPILTGTRSGVRDCGCRLVRSAERRFLRVCSCPRAPKQRRPPTRARHRPRHLGSGFFKSLFLWAQHGRMSRRGA